MRIQRTNSVGSFVILQGSARVGYVKGSLIGFHGFSNPADASWAAWEAYRALEFRHKGVELAAKEAEGFISLELGTTMYVIAQGAGRIARLVPPTSPESPGEGWGFDMDMAERDERHRTLHEVFLTANARVMWRGIRNSGRGSSMVQWSDKPDGRTVASI
jgi:hypothetical protein